MTRLDGIKGLLAALESVMSLRGTDTPEMARVNLQNFMQSNNEFIKALLLIKEVLSRFPDTTRQVGEQVVQLLTAAEEELLGQAVFNSAEGRINTAAGFTILPYLWRQPDRIGLSFDCI